MGLEEYLVPVQGPNICFDCAKACGACPWSRSFTPVQGWTATPVYRPTNQGKRRVMRAGYRITACPQFMEG